MNDKPDSPAAILAQPDEVLFQKMGCHTFALELCEEFQRVGINGSEIHYLEFDGNDELAAHVVVKTPKGYYDSKFGPRTEGQIKQDFPKHAGSKIVALPRIGWLTVGTKRDPLRSWLGLCVEAEFLAEARRRAKHYIEQNRARFGLA